MSMILFFTPFIIGFRYQYLYITSFSFFLYFLHRNSFKKLVVLGVITDICYFNPFGMNIFSYLCTKYISDTVRAVILNKKMNSWIIYFLEITMFFISEFTIGYLVEGFYLNLLSATVSYLYSLILFMFLLYLFRVRLK